MPFLIDSWDNPTIIAIGVSSMKHPEGRGRRTFCILFWKWALGWVPERGPARPRKGGA